MTATDWRHVYYDDAGRPRRGTVYLLHFDAPVRDRRGKHRGSHYLGWTTSFTDRIASHRRGEGCRFSWWAAQQGVGFSVALTFAGTYDDERRVRAALGSTGLGYAAVCPLCTDTPEHPLQLREHDREHLTRPGHAQRRPAGRDSRACNVAPTGRRRPVHPLRSECERR